MISFGDLKNNLEQLKKFLTKMKIFEECSLTPKDIEQQNLRKNNPDLFLRIINYAIVEYSTALYKDILQMSPDISRCNDKRFIQSVFSICRKILDYNPLLTQEQFCTNKFFQVKVQFLATLVKNIYYWDAGKKKNIINQQKTQKLEAYQKTQPFHEKHYSEEEEQEQPKSITLAPTPFNRQPIKPVVPKIDKVQMEKKTQKANIFPKNMKTVKQQQQPIELKKKNMKYQHQQFNQQQQDQERNQQDQERQFVSRKQFNQTLQLLLTVNETVNNMVQKFNNFQSSVLGWVNNINAKVSIMDENIKIIKANI